MNSRKRSKRITEASLIAAIYVILTYVSSFFGLSSGLLQCRLSEALCVLPAFTPAAIPGLFIGCLVSNFMTGSVIFDIIFGSIATLVGAIGTYYLAKFKLNVYLYTLPSVVANTLIIPLVLKYAYSLGGSIWFFYISVGIGELISSTVLGTMLYFSLEKHANRLFK